MRIGMMADLYTPHVSGVTNAITLNKAALEERGHQVFVFTFGKPVGYTETDSNILRSPAIPIGKTGAYFGINHCRKVLDILRTMDIVHVHHPFLSGQQAVRYCKPFGIPVVFTNHTRYDLYFQAYLPFFPKQFGEKLLKLYLQRFWRSMDLVIAPSAGVKRVLQIYGVDAPMALIPNGIDLRPFQNPVCRRTKESLGFSSDDVVMIFVGRLASEKNLSFLLRTFAAAHAECPRSRLVLIGDGPDRDRLLVQASSLGVADSLSLPGLVPYREIPGYLAACDAFVTASISEVHPLTVIEAMAAGLPVIGINSPGVGDTVQDGVTGLLAPEDERVFADRLIRMLSDGCLRRSLGAASRLASEQYNIQKTAALLEAEYWKLLQKKSAASPVEHPVDELRGLP